MLCLVELPITLYTYTHYLSFGTIHVFDSIISRDFKAGEIVLKMHRSIHALTLYWYRKIKAFFGESSLFSHRAIRPLHLLHLKALLRHTAHQLFSEYWLSLSLSLSAPFRCASNTHFLIIKGRVIVHHLEVFLSLNTAISMMGSKSRSLRMESSFKYFALNFLASYFQRLRGSLVEEEVWNETMIFLSFKQEVSLCKQRWDTAALIWANSKFRICPTGRSMGNQRLVTPRHTTITVCVHWNRTRLIEAKK